MNCLCPSAGKLFDKLKKKSWYNRFTLLMGKRQKHWLKLIRKLYKLPIFFSGGIKVGNSKRAKWAYLVHSATQSALGIRFIFPTGAVSYVTYRIIIWP